MLEYIIGKIARANDKLFEAVDAAMCSAVRDKFGSDGFYWWLGFEEGFEAYVISSEGRVFSLKNSVQELSPHDGRVVLNTLNGRSLRSISWLIVRAAIDVEADSKTHKIRYLNGDSSDIRYSNMELIEKDPLNEDAIERAREMRDEGKTLAEIAETVGKSTSTIHRWVKDR